MVASFEPFRGDVEELERLAHIAWRDEYGRDSYPNLYSPQYFDYLFGSLEHRDHLIGAYDDDRLMAFMAVLPRMFHCRGEIYRAVLGCLLVTRKEAFRSGMALGLTAKAIELNKKHNYDFALIYLETGHRSSRMLAKLKAAGNPVQKVKRMGVIPRSLSLDLIFASENLKWYERAAMRFLRLDKLDSKPPSSFIRPYESEDLTTCHELLDAYKDTVTLTRVFEPEELARELDYPPMAHSLIWEENARIRGLINWAIVEHVGRITQPWAWLNHLSFGDLDGSERCELVRAFLLKAKEQGAAGVVEWAKNYYPKKPLWKNRFIPYPRSVDMLAWVFHPKLDLSNISDVFEVQI